MDSFRALLQLSEHHHNNANGTYIMEIEFVPSSDGDVEDSWELRVTRESSFSVQFVEYHSG